MKRVFAVAAPFVAGFICVAPQAHADTYGYRGDGDPFAFRDELFAEGLYHEDVGNALSLGQRVCAARRGGFTEEQVVSSLDNYDEYTAGQAVEIVMGGEWHFCPRYYDDGTIGSGGRWYGPPIL